MLPLELGLEGFLVSLRFEGAWARRRRLVEEAEAVDELEAMDEEENELSVEEALLVFVLLLVPSSIR